MAHCLARHYSKLNSNLPGAAKEKWGPLKLTAQQLKQLAFRVKDDTCNPDSGWP